jgi:hypothetical protein
MAALLDHCVRPDLSFQPNPSPRSPKTLHQRRSNAKVCHIPFGLLDIISDEIKKKCGWIIQNVVSNFRNPPKHSQSISMQRYVLFISLLLYIQQFSSYKRQENGPELLLNKS